MRPWRKPQRVAEKGARTVSFPDSPVPLGLPSFHSDHWDGLWGVCSDAHMPVSLHFGSGGYVPGFSFSSLKAAESWCDTSQSRCAVRRCDHTVLDQPDVDHRGPALLGQTAAISRSAIFPRRGRHRMAALHPGAFRLLSGSATRYYQPIDFDTKPSDLFRRHFWGCFIDDEHGLINRHRVGVDRITLEIDFPHSDSNWPNSRKRAAEILAGVPDDECALIVEHNARRMLNFPRRSVSSRRRRARAPARSRTRDTNARGVLTVIRLIQRPVWPTTAPHPDISCVSGWLPRASSLRQPCCWLCWPVGSNVRRDSWCRVRQRRCRCRTTHMFALMLAAFSLWAGPNPAQRSTCA